MQKMLCNIVLRLVSIPFLIVIILALFVAGITMAIIFSRGNCESAKSEFCYIIGFIKDELLWLPHKDGDEQ